MAAEILGHVTCPHCGNAEATVHREAKGRRAMYYRCYGGEQGDCGTIQCRYKGGQVWITRNMRPLDAEARTEAVATAAAEAAVKQEAVAEEVAAKAEGRERRSNGALGKRVSGGLRGLLFEG